MVRLLFNEVYKILLGVYPEFGVDIADVGLGRAARHNHAFLNGRRVAAVGEQGQGLGLAGGQAVLRGKLLAGQGKAVHPLHRWSGPCGQSRSSGE